MNKSLYGLIGAGCLLLGACLGQSEPGAEVDSSSSQLQTLDIDKKSAMSVRCIKD